MKRHLILEVDGDRVYLWNSKAGRNGNAVLEALEIGPLVSLPDDAAAVVIRSVNELRKATGQKRLEELQEARRKRLQGPEDPAAPFPGGEVSEG